jgi:hypothetical protein
MHASKQSKASRRERDGDGIQAHLLGGGREGILEEGERLGDAGVASVVGRIRGRSNDLLLLLLLLLLLAAVALPSPQLAIAIAIITTITITITITTA